MKKVLRNQFNKVHNDGIVRNKYMLCNHDDFKQPRSYHCGFGTFEKPLKRLNTHNTITKEALSYSMMSPSGRQQTNTSAEIERKSKVTLNESHMEDLIPFINLYVSNDYQNFDDFKTKGIEKMKIKKASNSNKQYDTDQKKDFVKRLVDEKSFTQSKI